VEGASMTDIISRRCDVWAHKTNLTLPLFIEVLVASQESERSCICVLGIFSSPPLSPVPICENDINKKKHSQAT
jgi:hypothetical protein